ncbi:MAG TPA: GNAT family N-acetyltransferase [Ktedonobacterales bacterium]|jgi:GNAT superfamily N-acetyltransferase|nr:GNAT family N-acetyltransferase [Ktedonobacterales bacterium]
MPLSSQPLGYSFAALQPGTLLFDDAVRLYLTIWPGDTQGVSDFFTRYAALPDYHGFVALHGGALAGFGFGTRSLPDAWWHDRVTAQVGAEHPALYDAWVLVDLAVAPAHRGKGLGGALMETLLAAQPCPRALLSTEVGNATARRLYERHAGATCTPASPSTRAISRTWSCVESWRA